MRDEEKEGIKRDQIYNSITFGRSDLESTVVVFKVALDKWINIPDSQNFRHLTLCLTFLLHSLLFSLFLPHRGQYMRMSEFTTSS